MAERKLNFEASMARLEEIVSLLESGERPLEESLAFYEEGAKLLKSCTAFLNKAEQKVRKLRTDETGEITTAPFPVEQ